MTNYPYRINRTPDMHLPLKIEYEHNKRNPKLTSIKFYYYKAPLLMDLPQKPRNATAEQMVQYEIDLETFQEDEREKLSHILTYRNLQKFPNKKANTKCFYFKNLKL